MRSLFLLFSTVVFALAAFIPAYLAFHYPLELEVREGTSWLYVLARHAGVDLYDTTKVAFANLIYGPTDILFKASLAWLFPFLESYQVTRFFVPFVPLTLWLAAWGWRGRWMESLLLSGPLYLFLTCTDPMATIVGRPDPLAFCLANLICFLVAPRIKRHFAAREWLWLCLVGSLATLQFHASWRYAPSIFFTVSGSLVSFSLPPPVGWRARKLGRDLWWLGGVFAGLSLVLIYVEYGSYSIYVARTFGTYSQASGWGLFPAKKFSLMPNPLLRNAPVFIGGVWFAALATFWVNRRKTGELTFWIPVLSLLWVLQVLSYYANGEGGGVRYFFPALLLLWLAGMQLFDEMETRWPGWQIGFCLLAWVGLPWRQVSDLQNLLWTNAPQAAYMTAELRRIPRFKLWSDCFHLFKLRYEGDVVDTPDTALKLGESGFLGADFSKVVREHFAQIESQPPPYYLKGMVDPARVTRVYDSPLYRKLLEAPPHSIGNGFLQPATLFGRKEN